MMSGRIVDLIRINPARLWSRKVLIQILARWLRVRNICPIQGSSLDITFS